MDKRCQVKHYDASTIDQLPWPDTEEGKEAKRFIMPLAKNDVKLYVNNVETKMMALCVDDLVLPVTINDAEYENSFVCSIYGHFIAYAMESLDFLRKNWLLKNIRFFLMRLGKFLKRGHINKVICVNNWLVSTNLVPSLKEEQIDAIKHYLVKRFPFHAIVFRSLDTYINKPKAKTFRKKGFHLVASRQVYFTDLSDESLFRTRIFKSDLKLLRESEYEVVESHQLSPDDLQQILSLYNALYVQKHSALNPQFTEHYLKLIHKNKILHLKAIKKDGTIDGMFGYMRRFGVLTSPFFGYDVTKPQNAKLYRLLSTLLMLEAKNNNLIFHQSSGASFYKKIRRAKGYIEYTAVYLKHLPLKRQIPWLLLKVTCNTIGIPVMRKY